MSCFIHKICDESRTDRSCPRGVAHSTARLARSPEPECILACEPRLTRPGQSANATYRAAAAAEVAVVASARAASPQLSLRLTPAPIPPPAGSRWCSTKPSNNMYSRLGDGPSVRDGPPQTATWSRSRSPGVISRAKWMEFIHHAAYGDRCGVRCDDRRSTVGRRSGSTG